MVETKKRYTLNEQMKYRLSMDKNYINKYKPINLFKKVAGYGLISYGVATSWFPSGSQLALLGGCALLGIPFKVVWDKIKLYVKRGWFILCVICNKKRLKYELRRMLL